MKLGSGTKGARTKVDVGGILQTGRALDVHEALVLPDSGSYVFPGVLSVDLSVRRIGGGLAVDGQVRGAALGQCARCLEDVRLDLELDIDERLEPGADSGDPLDDNNVLIGDQLDLQDLARQVIDSALPLAVLCNPGCLGLCATCGHKRDGTCRCKHPE